MKYEFSNKVKNIHSSAVGDILKYSSMPGYIPLSAGNPSEEVFPVKEVAEISNEILKNTPVSALQYNLTEGYPALRTKLKEFLKKTYNTGTENDELIIMSGAQQTIDIVTSVLCNEGDIVITENPSFVGALNTFRLHGAKLMGVPVDSDGMDTEQLEKTLSSEKNVKLIYTIPNFQNPTGITMSLKKREALYNLAQKYNVIILEDNPYGDLRYSGEDIQNIKSLDKTGHVIYTGSFSKVISPGLRTAYCLAPLPIIQKMILCKQCQDVHSTVWSQLIAYYFMEKYDFSAHLKHLREFYGKKAEFTRSLLEKHFKNKISYTDIDGGFFVWCTLPENIDMLDFCNELIKQKVCVVPGTAFLTDENESCNSFRINFSTPSEADLEKGIKLIEYTFSIYNR